MSGRRIDTKDLPAILAALREHIRRIVAARKDGSRPPKRPDA